MVGAWWIVERTANDMPLESIHKLAFKAAEAANCAGEQGKYWEMHGRLFANQQAFEPWAPHAEALGLDVARFETCLSTGKYADEIRRDMAQAATAGVTGTPAFRRTARRTGGAGEVVTRCGARPVAPT